MQNKRTGDADPLLLTRHPVLLEQLEVAHAAGSAVSLIERQVELLRGKNQRLEARLEKLIDSARANEVRADKTLKLALALIRAPSLAAIAAGTTPSRAIRSARRGLAEARSSVGAPTGLPYCGPGPPRPGMKR